MRGSGPKPSRRRHEKREPGLSPEGRITRTTDSSGTGTARQRRWPNGQLHYAAAGLEVFPVDPDTKAPIGHRRRQRRNIWMAPKATVPPPTTPHHHGYGGRATRCPNRLPNTRKTWSCSISTPATTATTPGTPSSPVTIYRSHAVTLPAATMAVFTFGFGTPNGHRTQGP